MDVENKLNEDEKRFYIEEKSCLHNRIKCPKGSLVLWDSRTIHCGSEALKTRTTPNFRNVVYVCYEPRARCSQKNLIKKQTIIIVNQYIMIDSIIFKILL